MTRISGLSDPRRSATAAVALAALVACATGPRRGDALSEPEFGQFTFAVEATDAIRLTGQLVVTPDTILPMPKGTTCRVAPQQPSVEHLAYECVSPGTSGILLVLDRRSPVRRSTWSVVVAVRKTRDACIAWRTWENGTRTCTSTMPEDYTEQVRRTGAIVVTR